MLLKYLVKSVAVFFLFFFFAFSSLSQNNPTDARKGAMEATLPVVVLPSPNSAILTRMISENVDLYTGKLSVDIPLYGLKSRSIEVPISLQANANSHKVNDIGSWVGLGWHLNAGGVITRVMKNLPDEFSRNANTTFTRNISPSFNKPGYGFLSLTDKSVQIPQFNPSHPPFVSYSIDEKKNIINRGNWNTKTDQPDYGLDLQPDEFYFNFGKHSGKFVFDQSGNVKVSNNANLFITPTIANGKITAFTIITDDGYKYDFGNYALNAVEESKLKVESKTILFSYIYTGCYTPNVSYQVPNIMGTGNITVTSTKYFYERAPMVMSYLLPQSACSSPNGCSFAPGSLMDFWQAANKYQAEYPEYPSSWYLTKIVSPTNDTVTFSYADNGTLQYLADRSFSSSTPEMKSVGAGTGVTCNPNPIQYNPNAYFASYAPPKKITPDQYYSFYPSFGDYTISSSKIDLKSKRLKEIITSQGYKVEFIANTSRSDLSGDKRLDRIVVSKGITKVKEYEFNYENIYNNESAESLSFSFRAPVYNYYNGGAFAYTSFQNDSRTESGSYLDASVRYRMFLTSITEKGANQETLPSFVFDYYNKTDLPFRTSVNQDSYGFAKDGTAPPVTAKLFAGVLKNIKYPTGGQKEFSYDLSGNSNAWNGLKIIQVKEFVDAGSTAILKNYSYGTFSQADQAVSVYSMPEMIISFTINGQSNYYPVANKVFYSNSRVNPETQTRGSAGGYSFAEVSQPGNGKYRIEFITPAANPDQATNTMLVSGFNGGFESNLSALGYYYPFPQTTSNDWQRGLPTAEYYKKEDGTNIKSSHYEYDFTSTASGFDYSLGMQVTKYRIDYGTGWNWMIYGRYEHLSKWQILKAKTERNYHSDGTSYLENRMEVSYNKKIYNNKELLFQSEIKSISDSKNQQIIQRLKYPLDYTATTDVFGQGISYLKAKNIFSPVVEKYEYIQDQSGGNKRYTEGVLNKYHPDKPVLKQSYIFQPSTTVSSFIESNTTASSFAYDPNYKSAMNFNSYDTYGNIREQNEEGDMKESYIWDHNNTYPVAKVSNASLSDVAYASFEADGKGAWIYNQANVKQTEKGITGNKFFEIPAIEKISSGTLSSTQKYKITFWCKYGDPILLKYPTGGGTETVTPTSSLTINGWKYYEYLLENVIKVEIGKYSSVPQVIIDEVRLFPVDAQMVSYTFDPLVGMTSQCDPNNRILYYEYDGLQRLKLVTDSYGNVVKTYEYNYKQ